MESIIVAIITSIFTLLGVAVLFVSVGAIVNFSRKEC